MSKHDKADNKIDEQFDDWLRRLLGQLDETRQRRLLSCEGSDGWCDNLLAKIKRQSNDLLFLSDKTGWEGAVAFTKSETLLGREFRFVAVDLFSGLNPDALCIAAGLVKCGGLLILLSPGSAQWNEVTDPYGVWQNQMYSPENAFIDYFFERISADTIACIQIRQGDSFAELQLPPIATPTEFITGKSSDQIAVMKALENWLTLAEQKVALLSADRGRGKSTCLGFLVKHITESTGLSVCVTACSRQSADMLLAQCESVSFIAPDSLIQNQTGADVLVIDEAAMLPFPMLDQLCRQFKRVVMATTTGGYEGTGQGFLLRFVARLPDQDLSWFTLHQPIRWADNDCLERWIDDTFLLKPHLAISTATIPGGEVDLSRVEVGLLENHSHSVELKWLYRLMVSAHYRTRPSDFRALMENPDLVPFVAKYQSGLLGIALLNREGGFDPDLCQQVFLGRRRPKGHLLAQMLTAQAGLRDFATFRGLRVQRIAVTENHRRQGIGWRLIKAAENYAADNNFDYVGASFAFDSESAGFWQSCGFRLVHIGHGQGKSSGSHSVAVIKVLNPFLENNIYNLEEKMRSALALGFCQYLQRMNAADAVSLLRFSGFSTELTALENDEIEAFTKGHKGFELCFVTLQRAVMRAIADSPRDRFIHPWLIEKVVQNRQWHDLSQQQDGVGRKSIQNKIRCLIGDLIA